MALTPQEQTELNGLLQKHGLIAAAAQPDASQKQAPGVPSLDHTEADAANLAQGATMGWADEIGAGIAKPIAYAAKNLLPSGMGGEDVTYGQVSNSIDKVRQEKNSALQAFNEENPTEAFINQGIGGIASGVGISKLASSVAPVLNLIKPGLSNALTKFAESSPYWASAGVGGAQGAVYGAGASDTGDRAEGAAVGGVGGAVLGPALNYVGRNLVAPLASKAGSALEKFLASSEAEAPAATQAPISNITNAPMGAPLDPAAVGSTSLTGKLPLSPGVQSKDANLLRVEENARQGLLGQDAQNQMTASDESLTQGARNIIQQLKGATNKDSKSILSGTVEDFQQAGTATKNSATALYKERDQLMADSVLNKKKVGPSLGKALNDVTNEPENVAGFKSKSGTPAKQLYEDFKTLITGTQGDGLPFSDLAAWRQDVAHLAKTDQSTAGTMAGRLGRAYDNWMDSLTQDHVLSGDPGIAEAAAKASSAWKNYKELFTSKNTNLVEGMTKPYDKTPTDFVDQVFGKSVVGTNNTALVVRKMAAALPEDQRPQFTDNVFKGLVSRVFEDAGNADSLSLKNLRNNLSNLVDSAVYKESLANKERDTVIKNLVSDLDQHIKQTGRRDVMSPSGGAVMRGINKLLNIPASIPIVNKIPLVKTPAEIGNKVAELDQNFMDRKTFNRAMKGAAQTARKAASQGAVYSPSLAGIMGGTASGAVVQTNQKENKK